MRFLLDQSADARLAPYLESLGHDAPRIGKEYPHGLPDAQVLAIAEAEDRILIAADLDFGELVFRLRQPHAGVILLRLGNYAELSLKIERVNHVLTHYSDRLDEFLVVTRQAVRIGRPS